MAKATKDASTLGYALLGLLVREQLSGYDLATIMKERIRYFWSAQHSQIYPELAKLEEAGFVTHDVERGQTGRPDKKVFAITKEGRAALGRWVEEPFTRTPTRDETLLRVYCGTAGDPDVLAANLDAYASELEVVVEALERNREMLETRFAKEITNTRGGPYFGWATLNLGIETTRVRAKWCRTVAKQVARKKR
jgi:DNA-binding PadR family transcriptional regulator